MLNTALVAACLLCGCDRATEATKMEGFAQGTTYHLTFMLRDPQKKPIIEAQIKNEFARIDKAISNYRDDSAIEQFNAQATTESQEIGEEIVKLVETARVVSTASHGCYDLTIKPLFDLWGFKKDKFNLPDTEDLQQALASVGMDKLETIDTTHLRKKIPSLHVDLSSIGQGYTVTRMAGILEAQGVQSYLVEIGGELKVRGKKANGEPWRIAMEKPISTERKVEKIAVFESGEAMSLMPSGTYQHYFDSNGKRFSHILDARTGKPITHTTVVANAFLADATRADAWSTALLCMGSDEGMKVANENNIAALFIDQSGDAFIEKKSLALEKLTSVSLQDPEKD